jgi:hypothetical protein
LLVKRFRDRQHKVERLIQTRMKQTICRTRAFVGDLYDRLLVAPGTAGWHTTGNEFVRPAHVIGRCVGVLQPFRLTTS